VPTVAPFAGSTCISVQACPVVGTHSEPSAMAGTAADPPATSLSVPAVTDQRVAPVARSNELSLPADRT
jgi:hypothetical protein